jgi:hypothetical protein
MTIMSSDRTPVIVPEAVPLLQEALDYIHTHPEKWDQKNWLVWDNPVVDVDPYTCDAKGCLAGWIAMLSPEVRPSIHGNHHLVFRGRPNEVMHVACEILTGEGPKLEKWDYDYEIPESWGGVLDLFGGGNSEEYLWAKAAELTGGKIRIPSDVDVTNVIRCFGLDE